MAEREKESNIISLPLDQYCHDLEQKYSELDRRLTGAVRDRDDTKNILNAKMKELHDSQSALSTVQERLAAREKDISAKEKVIRDLELGGRDLEENFRRKTDEIDRKEEQIKKLSQEKAALDVKVRSQLYREDESLLKFEVNRLEKERKNWEDLYTNVTQELDEKRVELNESKMSLLSFKQARFDLDSKILELEHKVKERDNNLSTLQSYSESQDERISSYIKSINQLEDKFRSQEEAFLKENSSLRGLLKTFEKAVQDQGLEISKFQKEEEAMKRKFERAESDINEERSKFEEKIVDLERQLKAANDDMNTSGSRSIGGSIHSLVMFNRVGSGSEEGGEGKSVIEKPSTVIERYHNLEKQLLEEISARKKAEIYLKDILQAEKNQKPVREKRELDYQRLLNHRDVLEKRIETSSAEVSKLSLLSQRATQDAEKAMKELSIQKLVNADLSTQIQHLLKEKFHNGNYKASDGESYDGFISFSNIPELQAKNSELIEVINRLKEDYNTYLTNEDVQKTNLESKLKELEALREDRKHMEQSISVLSQQRDVFKAMSEEFASTANLLEKQDASTSSLVSQIGQLKMELSNEKDLKAKNLQRIAKFEEMEKFFDEELSKAKADSSKFCAELAKVSSDSRLNAERIVKLEHNFSISQADLKGQVERYISLDNKYQALQGSIHSKEVEISKVIEEKRKSLETLRRAQSELDIAKSSEARYKQQLEDAHKESKSQEDLFDAISKIELTLSQKYESENLILKNERDNLLNSNEHLRKENKNLSDDSRIRSFEEEIKVLNSKLDNKEQEISQINQSLIRESQLNKDAQDQKMLLDRQIKQLQDRLTQLQNASSVDKTLESQNKDRDVALLVAEAELEKLRTQLKQSDTRSEHLQELIKATEASKDTIHSTLATIRKKFEEDSSAKEAEIAALKKDKEGVKSNTISTLRDLEESNDKLRSEARQNELDKCKLSDELNVEKIQNSSLVAKISSLSADCDKFQQVARDSHTNYQRELQLHATCEDELSKSQSTVERISVELRARGNDIEALKDEISKKDALLIDSKKDFEMKVADSNAKIEALTEANNKMKEQIKLFRSEIDKFDPAVSKRQASSSSNSVEEDSSVEADKKEKYLSLKDSEINTKNELVSSLTERLNSARRQIDELTSQLKQSNSSHQFTRTEEEFAKVKNQASQLDVYLDDNARLRSERDEMRKKLSHFEVELSQAKNSIDPLNKDISDLRELNSKLDNERNAAVAHEKEMKDRLAKFLSQFGDVDPAEHAQLKKDLEQAMLTVAASSAALAENDSLKKQLGDSNASNEALKKQVEEFDSKLKLKAANIEALKKQADEAKAQELAARDALQLQIDGLNNDLKSKVAINETMTKQLADSKTLGASASEVLKKQVESLTVELASRNEEIAASVAEKEYTEKRLARYTDNFEKLKIEVLPLKTKNRELIAQLQALQALQTVATLESAPILAASTEHPVENESNNSNNSSLSSSFSTADLVPKLPVAPSLTFMPPLQSTLSESVSRFSSKLDSEMDIQVQSDAVPSASIAPSASTLHVEPVVVVVVAGGADSLEEGEVASQALEAPHASTVIRTDNSNNSNANDNSLSASDRDNAPNSVSSAISEGKPASPSSSPKKRSFDSMSSDIAEHSLVASSNSSNEMAVSGSVEHESQEESRATAAASSSSAPPPPPPPPPLPLLPPPQELLTPPKSAEELKEKMKMKKLKVLETSNKDKSIETIVTPSPLSAARKAAVVSSSASMDEDASATIDGKDTSDAADVATSTTSTSAEVSAPAGKLELRMKKFASSASSSSEVGGKEEAPVVPVIPVAPTTPSAQGGTNARPRRNVAEAAGRALTVTPSGGREGRGGRGRGGRAGR